VLHPVGNLPAAVYWRRRALVLTLLLSVLGGGGWLGYAVATGHLVRTTAPAVAAASTALTPPATPSLDRVVPALAAVRTPAPYGPCPDSAIAVRVGAPAAVRAGGRATLQLVVTNTSAVPCVRPLDRALQEIVLVDAAGHRIWDSNDCAKLSGSDSRTLTPRQTVSFALAWNGRSSRAGCTGHSAALPAGRYVLRGRLDTAASPDTPLVVR
jgi:hypothetical protein